MLRLGGGDGGLSLVQAVLTVWTQLTLNGDLPAPDRRGTGSLPELCQLTWLARLETRPCWQRKDWL